MNEHQRLDQLDEKNKVTVTDAWDEINSYKPDIVQTHPKSIIDLLNDFFAECVTRFPEAFLVSYCDLGLLTRCRKGEFTSTSDLLPPPIQIAKDYGIVNRWNPPEKRYLYVSRGAIAQPNIDDYTENEYTCLEEVRAELGNTYTFADFRPANSRSHKKILNMDYDGIRAEFIEHKYDQLAQSEAIRIASKLFGILPPRYIPAKESLLPVIENSSQPLAAGLVGELFLRIICQTIFTPIDDNESLPEQKMKAYGSFHTLADFLEKKDIAGVIFPSTRTRLKGYHTQNLVAFNVDDFRVIGTSMRIKVAK